MSKVKFRKNSREEERDQKPLYLVLLAFIFSSVVFLFLNYGRQEFRSEVSILLIPKSQKAAFDSEHLIENLKFFPKTLSFYNKLLKDNSYIKDLYSGLPNYQKEKLWGEKIKTKRLGNSALVKISVSGNSFEEVRIYSQAIISTLLSTVGFYYDIKNDIDIRIVDGPIVYFYSKNWTADIIFSLVLGLAASSIVFCVFYLFNTHPLRKNYQEKISDELFQTAKKIEPEYIIQKSKIKKNKEKDNLATQTAEKKFFAPENLPFVDEDYFRNNIMKSSNNRQDQKEKSQESSSEISKEKKIEETAVDDSAKEEKDIHREPTPEELKRRLNQLLRGEL